MGKMGGVKSKHLDLVQGITVLDDGSVPYINTKRLLPIISGLAKHVRLDTYYYDSDLAHTILESLAKTPEWRVKFSSYVSRLIDLEKGRLQG